MVGPVLFNSTKLADVFDRSDLALTCIDCIQRNGKWCFGWEPMIWSLYCMYLINHSRVSVSPFEKGDNHKLIHHLTMIDDSHYMQWWGMIATYSPFIATSSLYTYIKWYATNIWSCFFLGCSTSSPEILPWIPWTSNWEFPSLDVGRNKGHRWTTARSFPDIVMLSSRWMASGISHWEKTKINGDQRFHLEILHKDPGMVP